MQVLTANIDYALRTATGAHDSHAHRADNEIVGLAVCDHLATRVIYSGAGGFLVDEAAGVVFTISPRAQFIVCLSGGARQSESNRPLYHAKNESHSSAGWSRLHVISGENCRSQLSRFMKFGATSIAVRLAEIGLLPPEDDNYRLLSPVAALHTIALDPTMSARLPTRAGGTITALDYQTKLLALAQDNLARLQPWAPAFLEDWGRTLNDLATCPERLDSALDWRIKRRLVFGTLLDQKGLSWADVEEMNREWRSASDEERLSHPLRRTRSALCVLDLKFGEIVTGGIFGELDREGILHHRVFNDPGAVARATISPPSDTRAFARGNAIRQLHSAGTRDCRADWDYVTDAAPLRADSEGGDIVLRGDLRPGEKALVAAYVPGWLESGASELPCPSSAELAAATRAYWESALASAAAIDLPDPFLMNVIRASQVHCLLAARNEDGGERISPWIASVSYGPLESEANSIVRGMGLLGFSDFTRRSLDFFISRYSPAGMLTTGYTLMGTGWHLQTLGEHYLLERDDAWLRGVAPKVRTVCDWIVRQHEKTKRMLPDGSRRPEFGLAPPGVEADWNAYAYHFCLNGYYYAGLHNAALALAEIGHAGAGDLLRQAAHFRQDILHAYRWAQARTPVLALQDGTWVPGYPSQLHSPGRTGDFFPGEDGNRSWCYDVELGAHHLIQQGVLDAGSHDAAQIMDHMEDVQFLSEGWFDYPAEESRADWFNLGGFSKVQPYYTRNAEVCALRDDVKPFIRSYFNTLSSLLNMENLSLWEHFRNVAAWNKTHETGYFLQQTRFMLAMEHGEELWLAPLVTSNWMRDGMTVSASGLPTRFGPVSYRIASQAAAGYIEATVEAPVRKPPKAVVVRLRHPDGRRMKKALVNGQMTQDFDPVRETVRIPAATGHVTVRAVY